ncbi:hypothetical protein KP509_25G022300 [Ceratopteris richardii]|uniref:Uncharacterized protein n=1 Tax=Ceratopteris richardii TaxID=49495 RepID=A0A8T2RR02_CERRI|nr:hypothetical protein KP509_25G022300 [Ceratopteris richardii]
MSNNGSFSTHLVLFFSISPCIVCAPPSLLFITKDTTGKPLSLLFFLLDKPFISPLISRQGHRKRSDFLLSS